MSLTTPVPRDFDAVFPGENWFFYWKTSSSLWRAKLEASPETGPVIVPLNWSFHSETGENYDFAQTRPETNLKRLTEVVESLGRKTIFFLPITPAPFLPNGGIPHLLARVMALDEYNMGRSVIGPEMALNKMYSFYDPRVYQGFSRFVRKLGEYFTQEGISSDIYGINCGYLKSGYFHSFLEDRSKSFEQAFTRFLKAKADENESSEQGFINSIKDEQHYKDEFFWTIHNLYLSAAEEGLAGNWEGLEKICFLGADQAQNFSRLYGSDLTRDYTQDLFSILCRDNIPSSSLLPARIKKGVLKKQLEELIDQSFVESRLGGQAFADDLTTKFRPLYFFELYEGKDEKIEGLNWEGMGLVSAIEKRYLWSYLLRQGKSFEWNEDLIDKQSIHFVRGRDVDQKVFNNILKHFMSGGKLVLERSELDTVFIKKLEAFILENGLEVEKINLGADIHYISLGPGQLITIDAQNIYDKSLSKRVAFWDKIIQTYEITALELPETQGIEVAWRTRGSGASELNYEEVRRLSLYNPSSYRKKLKIPLGKHFVLTKVVDESKVQIHSTGQEVDIEFLPEGSVSIDIGVFS